MNNIIQLIGERVKREIEKNVINILDGLGDLDKTIDSVGEMVNNIGIDTLMAIIEELNTAIKEAPERKTRYHVHKSRVNRILVTRFGELRFERGYYKDTKNKSYTYILDRLLGIEKYERIEANLKGDILEKASDVSYQKAASLASSVPITRESVKKIIREVGPIDNLEIGIKEKKQVETIYIEADEDHVPLQTGKNREMKLIYVYDDKTIVNKGRTKLHNVRYFTGEMDPEDLWTEVASYIDEAYDLDKVENIYIAGDGARWIKTGTEFIKGSKYVLDHYHLSKYVKILTAHLGSLENPVYIDGPLWESMKAGNRRNAKELIEFAINETPQKSKKKNMRRAKRYILNNWEGIKNLFGKEKYRCSAEGHISHVLSTRLSSRPMGWSIVGADEMARMRAYKANGGDLREYYRKHRAKRKAEERVLKLDNKIAKRVKRAYDNTNPDIMIDMPYLRKPDGKWLKDMLSIPGF